MRDACGCTIPKDGSLAIALVLGVCTWPLNFFLEGKFDMSGWALAFPLNTLAGASIIVYHHTNYDAMRVSNGSCAVLSRSDTVVVAGFLLLFFLLSPYSCRSERSRKTLRLVNLSTVRSRGRQEARSFARTKQ